MTSETIRSVALACGAAESPYSAALLTDSLNLEKFSAMLIAQLIDEVSDFGSTNGSPDPVAESNSQGYNDAIAQVTEHLREKYLT